MATLHLILIVMIFVTLCSVVYHSWLSRTRQKSNQSNQLPLALMNMNMGLLFLTIALFVSTFPGQWYRYLLIVPIAGMGIINLYYGIKRYRWHKKQQSAVTSE